MASDPCVKHVFHAGHAGADGRVGEAFVDQGVAAVSGPFRVKSHPVGPWPIEPAIPSQVIDNDELDKMIEATPVAARKASAR